MLARQSGIFRHSIAVHVLHTTHAQVTSTERYLIHSTLPEANYKQLLDEVFAISGIIKVEVTVIEADNIYRDLDYPGYRKNRI